MDIDFLILPALFFTLFATIVGAIVLGKIQDFARSTSIQRNSAIKTNTNPPDYLISSHVEAVTHGKQQDNKITNYSEELHSGVKHTDTWEATMQTDILPRKSHQIIAGSLCEKQNDDHVDCPIVKRMGGEDKPLKYMPGMLRTSQLEKMMSKEELEEEQRVQREQLTAIFKLLKENQDTFGEMTEKDMEQQLKLYSI